MASSLTIEGVDAAYGAVRVLEDVSIDGHARRDGGAARHQRQRQKHADEMHHGHGAARAPAASSPRSTARTTTWSAAAPRQIVDLGIALVPEGRRLFPSSRSRKTCCSAPSAAPRARQIAAQSRLLLRGLSRAARAAQPARRHHERRRAADAGARPRADVGAADPAGRRAVGRSGAAAGRAARSTRSRSSRSTISSPC